MAINPGSAVSWIVQIWTQMQDAWHNYTNPADTEEDEEYETVYVTQIRYLGPIRETKYILVNEMPNFFSDEELNKGYHTKQEYVQANDKYGYIFKHQKFENADTVEKLQSYATDWIKNNYHGGLTSFDITAFDMHLAGENVDSYMVGDRIEVIYPDPDLHEETSQRLTCISAEYDLYNPEKTKYKIGIPDATLNKVYGETTKSGGGGGGGKNTEDENDEEDDKEAETTQDRLQKIIEYLDENGWSFMSKWLPGGDDGTESSDPNLQTPKSRDFTNPFNMNMMADSLLSGDIKATIANFTTRMTSKFGQILNDLNVGNNTKVGNDLEVTNDAKVKNELAVDKNATVKEKTTTKELEVGEGATAKNMTASEKVKGTTGEFDELTVGGEEVATKGDIPSLPQVTVTIDGSSYTLYGKKN